MASIQDARDELNRILKELELVIEKNPNDAPAFFKKGLALSELGKKKDAILAFNQAIAINPNDAYAFISKGRILSALGKKKEAIDAYDQAIAVDPNDAYVTAISLDPSLFDKIKHQNLIKEILNNLREYLDEKKLLIDVITRFSNNQYFDVILKS